MTREHAKPRMTIGSWKDAQRQQKTILARLHGDSNLLLASFANPLFALEELGYDIDEGRKQEFEDHLRFPLEYEEIASLRTKIFHLSRSTFSITSAKSLLDVLSNLLEKKVARTITLADTAQWYAIGTGAQKVTDPLERLRDAHPIMKPLLKYRRIEAGIPPFADRQVYEEIRGGKHASFFSNITVRHAHQ